MSEQLSKPTISNAGIYISVPYCRQKCSYCNFASAARPIAELPQYLRALECEIAQSAELRKQAGLPAWSGMSADSIYMGGGTPGLLTSQQLGSLLATVRTSFHIDRSAEITLEASPENVSAESVASWASCGINRVSLGIQSMVVKELRAVGRMHDPATVRNALSALRDAGIQNISVDLIAGLPHQTESSWEETLESVLALEPAHASVYMLEVDPDSRLGAELLQGGTRYGAPAVPSEEQVVEHYMRAMERLAEAGFIHYEISNFARPGQESRHNEKYWTQAPYFGFGVDAHSFDGDHRWANADSIADYLARMDQGQPPIQEWHRLGAGEKIEERFFLGLRRRQGISLAAIEAEFGVALQSAYEDKIREFSDAGWLETNGGCLRLTDRGILVSNEVFAGFLA